MVEVQRKKEYGVKFLLAISKELDYIIGFIFIDVTDLGEGNLQTNNDSIDKIAERM